MKFVKYSSLENHYRDKFIDQFRFHGLSNERFMITEKIHGANFSFWTNGTDVQVASRSQFVDGTFYSCSEVIERYTDAIRDLHCTLGMSEDDTVAVYGELFGPGIQKGIRYGNVKDFVAFDVAVNGEYQSAVRSKEIIDASGFEFVPVIGFANSLNEALATNNVFDSALGARRGETGENIAEGLVIQLADRKHTFFGDTRAVIKSKNELWAEKAKAKKPPRETEDYSQFVEVIKQYINVNRLAAVLSKFGEVTPQQFGVVIREFSTDVIEDMVKDGDLPSDWREKDDFKNVGKAVNSVAVPFLKSELLLRL